MVSEPGNKVLVDPDRIETLEEALRAFHVFFSDDISGGRRAFEFFKHQFRKYYFVMPPAWKVLFRTLSAKKRVAPDFTSTGAIRSGTSNLSNYILQHPCIALPLSKELSTIMPRDAFIRAQFPTIKEMQALEQKHGMAQTGNFSPILPSISWIYWGKALNPDMKFVIMLRNPVDRLFSHWRWNKMVTGVFDKDPIWAHMPDFEESMRVEMRDFSNGGCGFHLFSGAGLSSYMRHSVYLPFMKVFYETFDRDSAMIVNADDFFKDPMPLVKEVYAFLGLPDCDPLEVKEKNAAPPMDLDPAFREELVEFYEPFNQQLYEFLDRDFGWK